MSGTNEQFYDEQIAPVLADLAEKCRARGMSMLATVEYEPGQRGSTLGLIEGAGLEMVMVAHCINTAPNIDGYVIGLARYARTKGIDTGASLVMRQFGATS